MYYITAWLGWGPKRLPQKSRHQINRMECIIMRFITVALFVAAAIPTLFGHGQVGTAVGETVTFSFYFVLLLFSYLVNNSDIKNTIVEDTLFRAIRGIFSRTNIQVLPK